MIRKLAAGVLGALTAIVLTAPAPATSAPGPATPGSATPGSATPGSATPPPGAIECTYVFIAWPGGFSADIAITNSGPRITGWTVRWSFHDTTVLAGAWMATIVQTSPYEMTATNRPYNAVIDTGQTVTFGWSAAAAATSAPDELTVNNIPC
jgi:hypothetical protein